MSQEALREKLSKEEALRIIGSYEGQISFGAGSKTTIKGIQSQAMAKILEDCVNSIARKATSMQTVWNGESGSYEFSCSDWNHDFPMAIKSKGIEFEGSKYVRDTVASFHLPFPS